jgi:C-terminal processing protease CtpA/Prc
MQRINRRTFAACVTGGLALASMWSKAGCRKGGPAGVEVGEVVQAAAEIVRREYVDAAVAKAICDALLRDLATGRYAGATSRHGLAERLTDDLRARTNDLHMSVTYEPRHRDDETPDEISEDDLDSGAIAWGVQSVARLAGNIGLLRVTHFESGLEVFASRCSAAMTLLRHTAALILDLTVNHGGDGDSAAYFVSYFVDGQIELGRVTFRHGPEKIVKTYKTVAGPRYGESRPIFVAISNKTFSAGEALASQLKSLRGATLIGRRTRGGAHIGEFFDLPDDFKIFVVTARDLGRDWERVGVAPEIPVEPEFAVGMAHRLALRGLIDSATDERIRQVLCNVRDHSIENLSSFRL